MILGFLAKTYIWIFFLLSFFFFFKFFFLFLVSKFLKKGVHVVARKGRPIAILEHLNALVGAVSQQQKAKLIRQQKSLEILRRYRMSKVRQTKYLYSFHMKYKRVTQTVSFKVLQMTSGIQVTQARLCRKKSQQRGSTRTAGGVFERRLR